MPILRDVDGRSWIYMPGGKHRRVSWGLYVLWASKPREPNSEKMCGSSPGWTQFEVRFLLPHPRLWWTWDRGEQPLYELLLVCDGHEERVRFAVRSIELRDWKVYLNGERTFLRGINYLPTDAYPARCSEDRLRADARLVRGANMNAV